MNRNLLFTIVLSTLILYVGLYIQGKYYPSQIPDEEIAVPTEEKKLFHIIPDPDQKNLFEKEISFSTNKFHVTFSTKNAAITSLKSRSQTQSRAPDIELIPLGQNHDTFRVTLGDEESAVKEDVLFAYNYDAVQKQIEFSREFINERNGQEFILKKTYTFLENENVFEITLLLQNKENEVLDFGDTAYSLHYGPQLGPIEEVLPTQKSKQISLRRFVTYSSKKRRYVNVKNNRSLLKDTVYQWVGITGRYFSVLIMPSSGKYETVFSATAVEGLKTGAQITLIRKNIQSAAAEDSYRVYIGPKSKAALTRYNRAETNGFEIAGADFDKSIPQRWLGLLERLWLLLLRVIYSVIPNYGIAIILLTIFIRTLTYPILRKSKASGEKMKLLSPKMQEIKEKYPNDSMKQSQEIMALYKTYGFSPMSSFLPILIQLPVFLSMYRVISESFELFQAPFFSWIVDLSSPDTLFTFGEFSIPLLGWSEFHLLPVLMLGTQFVSSYIMMKQQKGQNMGSQKLMFVLSYVFPFIIFFALYNSPSGLILYWITSNLVTVLTIFDNKTQKQVKLVPVRKKENSWKKFLKQGQSGRR